mmetsp:Transcript_84256/g.195887  ORF Transcript_84256/g.195887 Transcript_84256/m.195887 type:complete len:1018 (+) Transcript_84256:52-3105(+)
MADARLSVTSLQRRRGSVGSANSLDLNPVPPGRESVRSTRRTSVCTNSANEKLFPGDRTPTSARPREEGDRRTSVVSRRRYSSTGEDSNLSGLQHLKVQEEKRKLITVLLSLSANILQNRLFSCLMMALTLFVLVGDDTRLLAFTAEADSIFNVFTVLCLCLFTFEIILSSLSREDYFLGFWFFCDILASASLIFDHTQVAEAIMAYPAITLDNLPTATPEGFQESEYARASRASRVGTRVARLLRVVRLVRLSRIVQCFVFFVPWRTGENSAKTQPGYLADVAENQMESRVGRKLSERTTQRVILIVLAMLFLVPQIDPGEDYTRMSTSAQYGANVIFQAWTDYELALLANETASRAVLLREEWEVQLLLYIYYHNLHAVCPSDIHADSTCADQWTHKLCWLGYVRNHPDDLVPDPTDTFRDGHVQLLTEDKENWDQRFSTLPGAKQKSRDLLYVVGSLPNDVKEALARPWTTSCIEKRSETEIIGVSMIRDLACPRNEFRMQETVWFTPDLLDTSFFKMHMEGQFVFVYDNRKLIRWEAIINMVQTCFVVVVLAIGALLFSRDADQLVLLPIERMIFKVDAIRQDPLTAIRLGDANFREEDEKIVSVAERGAKGPGTNKLKLKKGRKRKRKNTTLETKVLENAIIKLGSLLALGFGEAGSEIIGHNLDDDNATVDALVPGSKVEAIYGWCGIRHFATATDVLQENTMVFVNQVAEIVHRIVDEHLGAANKNVGEAFLLVWRIGLFEESSLQSKVADLSVMSFIKVVAELNRDRQLAEYREHPALLARLPRFRVSLGFGLHLGWSIEGAIGSEFKIDASYLSPHVNVACSLEAATTEYEVPILMSEPLVRSCNPSFSRNFRPVDHVKLTGSKTTTRLFTVDLDYECLSIKDSKAEKRKESVNRYQERQLREQAKDAVLQEKYKVNEIFNTDVCVVAMRARYPLKFFQDFERGYLNYEAGEWDVAEQYLLKTKTMLWNFTQCRVMEDGPSRALLEFMRSNNFEVPRDWQGWRELAGR